ncbi:hypothetical protein [Nocardia terpenica]|uniref:hypothetical protein n=1 Tax=Nocardia terpenica TaxID=455432 RepID=UPI000AC7ABF8|nr:hypothetical protein [Nocardia terpenica]NQE93357.1 hypothetical protein [Nocardia terpenica]
MGSPRARFAVRLVELFNAAGNPTLQRVEAAAVARLRAAQPTARTSSSVQRISDWRSGRNVPARFEPLAPVLATLIDMAKAKEEKSAPVPPYLLDLSAWRRLWKEAAAAFPPDQPKRLPHVHAWCRKLEWIVQI